MATLRGLAANLYPIPGLALQSYGLFAASVPTVISGTAVLCIGLAIWARKSSVHPAWGLCGAIPLLAFCLLHQPAQPAPTTVAPAPAVPLVQPLRMPTPAKPQPEAKAEPAAVAPAPPAPAPKLPFDQAYALVKIGMTLDEVKALAGEHMTVISRSPASMLVKWQGPDGQSFNAHFKNGKVDLVGRLQKPGTVPLKDPLDNNVSGQHSKDEDDPALQMLEDAAEADDAASQPAAEPVASNRVITGRAKPDRVVRIGEGVERKPRPLVGRAKLPRYSGKISRGANDVNFFNHGENTIQVGVRLGMRGIDLTIPPGGMETVFLSNGTYTITYIDEGDPKNLKDGGVVVVDSPPIAIRVDLARPQQTAPQQSAPSE